jgi:hypothetical protein
MPRQSFTAQYSVHILYNVRIKSIINYFECLAVKSSGERLPSEFIGCSGQSTVQCAIRGMKTFKACFEFILAHYELGAVEFN